MQPRRDRKRIMRRALVCAILLGLLAGATPLALRAMTSLVSRAVVFDAHNVPPRRVAIVFGAGIWPDGSLTPVLQDRVDTAIALYRQGKVEKLLMTGDNRVVEYNEPQRMYEYAIAQGVPGDDIVLDYAGRRTYDSCYRARHIFEVDSAILVTQAYHLDRALFTARRLGIDAVGARADQRSYLYIQQYRWRELLATTLAWWEVLITRPEPVLGEKLPIFPA